MKNEKVSGPLSAPLHHFRLIDRADRVSGQDSVHYYMVPMLVLLMAVIGCCLAAFSTVTEMESKRIELLRSTGLAELVAGLMIAHLVFDFTNAGSLGAFFLGSHPFCQPALLDG